MLAFRFRDQADPAGHESSVALPAGSAQCAHPEMHPPQHHLCVVSSVLPLVGLMESTALSLLVAGPNSLTGLAGLSLPSPPKLPV